jgi:RNA polymerase sigma factor (sigma-70 family)
LVAAVALVCGSHAAAEDAVQEGLLRAWEHAERGEDIASLSAWVATAALNRARSGLRRLRTARRLRGVTIDRRSSDLMLETDQAIDVARALAKLPRRQREVTVLRYYLQFDTKEISQTLGIHEGTVKSTLSRARAALSKALDTKTVEEANPREHR